MMSILGIALPLLGLGGIGAALWFIPGLLPAVIAFAKAIPTKVWIAIAAVALLVAGYFIHQHKAHAALAAEYARGSSDRDAGMAEAVRCRCTPPRSVEAKAEAAATKISQEERARHDEEIHSIAARADDQRLHGPGAAAAPCGGHGNSASLPAGPGGHVAADRSPDAGVDRVPAGEGLAIVSWDDLVDWAAAADGWRSEALTWRAWYPRQAEANRVAREAGPKP
jgi:hypothetical protein